MLGGFSAALPSRTICIRRSSALLLSIFFSAVAPWHILHFPLYKAAASSSVVVRAGTETNSAAATSGIPIKAAAIFFIIGVAFRPNFLSNPPGSDLGSATTVPCEFCRKTQHHRVTNCEVFLRIERIFARVEVSTTASGSQDHLRESM